jgi:hypothetical protein
MKDYADLWPATNRESWHLTLITLRGFRTSAKYATLKISLAATARSTAGNGIVALKKLPTTLRNRLEVVCSSPLV